VPQEEGSEVSLLGGRLVEGAVCLKRREARCRRLVPGRRLVEEAVCLKVSVREELTASLTAKGEGGYCRQEVL
jgi:hypothetical protein